MILIPSEIDNLYCMKILEILHAEHGRTFSNIHLGRPWNFSRRVVRCVSTCTLCVCASCTCTYEVRNPCGRPRTASTTSWSNLGWQSATTKKTVPSHCTNFAKLGGRKKSHLGVRRQWRKVASFELWHPDAIEVLFEKGYRIRCKILLKPRWRRMPGRDLWKFL